MYYVFPGQLYGLEKFWAFLKYYKHAQKLQVDPKLKGYLSNFKTIEDFRIYEVIPYSSPIPYWSLYS